MAIYDDYMDNNPYKSSSMLTNNVNNYLGVNSATLPQSANSLYESYLTSSDAGNNAQTAMSGAKLSGQKGDGPFEQGTEGNIYGQNEDLLSDFVSQLGGLNPGQQQMILRFLSVGNADELFGADGQAGISSEEYANLFGVSQEYANRFQGFPTLLDIKDQIQNISNYGDRQRGAEQRSAQRAYIDTQKNTSNLTMGRGEQDSFNRRDLQETLNQRISAAQESEANRYGQLVSSFNQAINRGFGISGDILNMNPEAGASGRIDPITGQWVSYGDDTTLGGTDTIRTTKRT